MDSFKDQRLVIFGCGYIGSALARAAAAAGARVTALTRNPEATVALKTVVDRIVLADLASEEWHARIPGGAAFVVNCVGAGGGGLADYRRSYVEGLHSIRRWLAAGSRPAKALVYTSSTSVYPQDGGVAVDETAEAMDPSPRGRILAEAEVLLRERAGVEHSYILRLAGIYGPGRHQLLDQLRAGVAVIAGGAHRLNLAHRDDIVSAILMCLVAPGPAVGEIFNVADGAPAPREDVITWLAARLGRPAPRFTAAAGGARRGGGPAPDRIISSARLQARLGWRPRYPDYRAGYEAILGGG